MLYQLYKCPFHFFNFSIVCNTFSILFIFPIIVALLYKESFLVFVIPQIISLILGILLNLIDAKKFTIFAKDGFKIVALSWIMISIIGALPFYLNNDASFIDALFETVSGFTTTGATIFEDVEILNKSILFWRSFTHFILAFIYSFYRWNGSTCFCNDNYTII